MYSAREKRNCYGFRTLGDVCATLHLAILRSAFSPDVNYLFDDRALTQHFLERHGRSSLPQDAPYTTKDDFAKSFIAAALVSLEKGRALREQPRRPPRTSSLPTLVLMTVALLKQSSPLATTR